MVKNEKVSSQVSNATRSRKSPLPKQEEHVYGKNVICHTDSRGYKTHRNLEPARLRLHSPGGVIPLWAEGCTLRFRINHSSFHQYFEDPDAAKDYVSQRFADALNAWGDAAPVKFAEADEAIDFEIVMEQSSDCDINGCVLASAFFPDAGRHSLNLYPTMFDQSESEQIATLAHELGHVFGLRHFFANISETQWPSKLFGEDRPFSIMNYGAESVLTEVDRSDLRKLYKAAWDGSLTKIDQAPIELVRPFSSVTASRGSNKNLAARELFSQKPCSCSNQIQMFIGGRKITID